MNEFKNAKIGEKALLVSFMRVKVGKEFEVARELSKRFSDGQDVASYYTCYGQYDLLECLMVDSYESMHNVPFNEHIIDCEFSLFYSWENISKNIFEWAKGFPALVIVLLKLQPCLEEYSNNFEKEVINNLVKRFEDDINLFASMGRSEFLLIIRGQSFEHLFQMVSDIRQKFFISGLVGKVAETNCKSDNPVFIDTTTFPIIAHPALQGQKDYGKLAGKVLPIINIICYPGNEKAIVSKKLTSCSGGYNIYGPHDVVFLWDDPIELSVFAKELTDFRQSLGETQIISSSTSFLSSIKLEQSTALVKSYPVNIELPSKLIIKTEHLIYKSHRLEPMLKARLLEFLDRLNSYYGRPEATISLKDMIGICHSITWAIDKLESSTDSEEHELNTYFSELTDLANNALYQRYAGLETHFEVCKHLPFPFLRGINGYIAAATYVPRFILQAVYPEKKIADVWPGFVLFGMSYSYQLLKGRIISYPASSLHKPIEDWWGISHEVAHAIYRMSAFYQKELPDEIRKYFDDIPIDRDNHMLLNIDVEEIFANWFDFKYVFASNKERYFPIIWRSWLRWERVKNLKDEYLLRSLIIYLTTDLKGFFDAQNTSFSQTQNYLVSKYEEMANLIVSKVPKFKEFTKDVPIVMIKEAAKYISKIEPYLNFLENEYFEIDIFNKMNPAYPDDLIKKHIKDLSNGILVTEEIPSPIKLLHGLYDEYVGMTKEVPLRVTAATVLTLRAKNIM